MDRELSRQEVSKQNTSKLTMNTRLMPRGGGIDKHEKGTDFTRTKPVLIKYQIIKIGAGMYAMRKKHSGRKRENKDVMQEE